MKPRPSGLQLAVLNVCPSLVRLARELWLLGIPEEIAVDCYDLSPEVEQVGTVIIDDRFAPQQYCLSIDADTIELRAADNDGIRYGLATLWCLRQHGLPIAQCSLLISHVLLNAVFCGISLVIAFLN